MSWLSRQGSGRGASHAGEAVFACTMRARLRGLLGCDGAQCVMVLAPCCSIHTYGMRFPIDVAFVSADGTVLEAHRNVGPGKRLRCRRAVATFEREAAADTPWFAAGQQVILGGVRISEGCSMESEANRSPLYGAAFRNANSIRTYPEVGIGGR